MGILDDYTKSNKRMQDHLNESHAAHTKGCFLSKEEASEFYRLLGQIKGYSDREVKDRVRFASTGRKPFKIPELIMSNVPPTRPRRHVKTPQSPPPIRQEGSYDITSDISNGMELLNKYMKTNGKIDPSIRQGKLQRFFQDINKNLLTTVKTLSLMYAGFQVVKKLEKVPSSLQGVLKILDIGILMILKPLADLLAWILMPIAVNLLKLAIWINEQSEWVRRIVGFVELILFVIGGLLLLFKGKGTASMLKGAGEAASKVISFVLDSKVLNGFLSTAETALKEWWNKSKLKGILDWLWNVIKLLWEKSPFKTFFNWVYDEALKLWNKSPFKGIWDKIYAEAIQLWDKSPLKGVWDTIHGLIDKAFKKIGIDDIFGTIGKDLEKIVGEKVGIGSLLKALVSFLGKALDIALYASIISAVAGWIADKLDTDNPFKYLFEAVEDAAYVISELDPVGWLLAIASDISKVLSGSFTWDNSEFYNKAKGIWNNLIDVFKDIYNMIVTLHNKIPFVDDWKTIDSNVQDENNDGGVTSHAKNSSNNSSSSGSSGRSTAIDDYKSGKTPFLPFYFDDNTYFASGGIVTSPTKAIIGESGPEAVVPLDDYGGSLRNNITINFSGVVDEQKMRSIIRDEAEKIFNVHTRVRGNVW